VSGAAGGIDEADDLVTAAGGVAKEPGGAATGWAGVVASAGGVARELGGAAGGVEEANDVMTPAGAVATEPGGAASELAGVVASADAVAREFGAVVRDGDGGARVGGDWVAWAWRSREGLGWKEASAAVISRVSSWTVRSPIAFEWVSANSLERPWKWARLEKDSRRVVSRRRRTAGSRSGGTSSGRRLDL
jgi:hypothetical protein